MSSALDKVLRLAQEQQSSSGSDEIRELVQATQEALREAVSTSSHEVMAEMIMAAHEAAECLGGMLYTEGMGDWVEATAVSDDLIVRLASDVKEPYGDVTYADPGYRGKKKRYPLSTEAKVRAAWSYINMPKNAAKYTSAQLSSIKGKIKSAMKSHGIGRNTEATVSQLLDGEATVVMLAAPSGGVPMHHAPFKGRHSHAHTVGMAHDHEHDHHDDNQHGGSVHGRNPKEKAWANESSDRGAY